MMGDSLVRASTGMIYSALPPGRAAASGKITRPAIPRMYTPKDRKKPKMPPIRGTRRMDFSSLMATVLMTRWGWPI